MRQKLATESEPMFKRLKRLLETFIAKKYVAWGVANWFLWEDKITGTDWIMLTCGIFVIDAWSKRELLNGTIQDDRRSNIDILN